jgi:hypothetical protein
MNHRNHISNAQFSLLYERKDTNVTVNSGGYTKSSYEEFTIAENEIVKKRNTGNLKQYTSCGKDYLYEMIFKRLFCLFLCFQPLSNFSNPWRKDHQIAAALTIGHAGDCSRQNNLLAIQAAVTITGDRVTN